MKPEPLLNPGAKDFIKGLGIKCNPANILPPLFLEVKKL